MNISLVNASVIDKSVIGWSAVLVFVVFISTFIYRLQQSLNTDLGGLKSVRII